MGLQGFISTGRHSFNFTLSGGSSEDGLLCLDGWDLIEVSLGPSHTFLPSLLLKWHFGAITSVVPVNGSER